MYRLAGALDDVCDHIDEAASRVVSYGVEKIRLQAKEQAHTIRRSARKLADAVAVLEGFQDSRAHLAELRELEHVADRILQDSISSLFMARPDPLEVIRWKDIHESLEEAMNACEYAANVLEAIVVKNR
jgi:Phosphate transport regulator (distant homolog of PhoU)